MEKKFWNEEMETMPLDKLRSLQEKRLQSVVAHAYEHSRVYKRKFDEAGVKPSDISTLGDIVKLPLTDDLGDIRNAPFEDKLSVPLSEIKMYHSTSGTTTGIPEPIPYSTRDVKAFFEGEARGRWTIGARPDDVVQVLTGFDCCHRGYVEMGATCLLLSAGRGFIDKQISLTQTAGVTIIEHMPSLMINYFERAKELGFDVTKSKLRLVSGVGEAWAETYKKKMETKYGIPFTTLWGSVELGVAASQCEKRCGMHIFSDLIYLEILDPETGTPLPDGEEGEIVVTALLMNEAFPLIRYKVGDVSQIYPYELCACGRTHPRMAPVKGRISQIVKVAGKKVMPLDIEEVMASIEGLAENYQIVIDRPGELKKLKVKLEYQPGIGDLNTLRNRIEEVIHQNLGVESEIELLERGSIVSDTYKAQRIIKTY
ncbi:MAG: Phenylacetate-coenzyme A ligase [bacterium]|nr:MAG: Phenylacetate-coenzyme A ligase [bacterium]